ncbi:porin [Parasphingopyxis algicola]|uniref:porin n=1 Tax=Parasphingopyxis algicola TaxID=2026624 RepID=UPI001FE24C60|nr:porin [Parasphingopyxis algicola]
MYGRITLAALAGSALFAVGLTAMPDAAESQARSLSLNAPETMGTFTPASGDPAMARALRRAGISSRGMRFTPSASRQGDRPVTVAVRARASTAAQAQRNAEMAMATGSQAGVTAITPSAYNLGVSVGWRRFAISGDVARIDNGIIPGRARESADVGLSYSGRRWSTRVQVSADRPTAESAPSLIDNEERVAVDVGGSYSIARNIDITGGVRYQRQHRLEQPDDERRDSQAVYIGTAFRF